MSYHFDWRKFCIENNIHFVTSGPHTAAGNISIKCPWCAEGDKSEHMGLLLDSANPVWGCFRNSNHAGRNPARLVAALLGVRLTAAELIVNATGPELSDFEAAVNMLCPKGEIAQEQPESRKHRSLTIPPEFRRLGEEKGHYSDLFFQYLSQRGFSESHWWNLTQQYPLYYAITGEQAWRLVFLVYDEQNRLAGWTGREIRKGAKLRYRASDDLGKDVLLGWHFDNPDIIVCEGPLDALKLDYCGRDMGVAACATMGTAFTSGQVSALRRLKRAGKRLHLCLDPDALGRNMELADELGSPWLRLPDGIEDPGALTIAEGRYFVRGVAKRN